MKLCIRISKCPRILLLKIFHSTSGEIDFKLIDRACGTYSIFDSLSQQLESFPLLRVSVQLGSRRWLCTVIFKIAPGCGGCTFVRLFQRFRVKVIDVAVAFFRTFDFLLYIIHILLTLIWKKKNYC